MKKIKNILYSIASILFEHATLFAAIIASVYIITRGQLHKYETYELLLWIIGLLGLIAVASVSEKYFKLSKIEKSVEKIQAVVQRKGSGLDELAFTRKDLNPLEERLSDAKTIVITGGSLYRLSDEYFAFFESKLISGCQIEIIMVEPYSNAANLLCDNVVYETNNYNKYSMKIEESLKQFMRLKEKFSQYISIRLTKNVPPFSLIVIDEKASNASIKVELYSYSVPTRERMQFEVTRDDAVSFSFFLNQLIALRNETCEIDESYYSSEVNTEE